MTMRRVASVAPERSKVQPAVPVAPSRNEARIVGEHSNPRVPNRQTENRLGRPGATARIITSAARGSLWYIGGTIRCGANAPSLTAPAWEGDR